MDGWIKLHRKITEHWVWNNPNYLKAWLTIIITVNHESKKVLIHKELIDCERGQSILSLKSWAEIFGKEWSIQRVRTFFDLLKCDSMVTIEGLHKTTRLTVCNYDSYQDSQQTDNTQVTSKEHASNKQVTTNKNDKNDKNDKNERKENIIPPTPPKGEVKIPKKQSSPINKKARDIFEKKYIDTFEQPYYWSAKDAGAMTSLLSKIKFSRGQKNMDTSDENILYAVSCFLDSIDDGWIFENYSVTNLNSKYNEIVSKAKSKEISNGNRQTSRAGISNSAADKAASRKSLEEQANAILGINQPKNSPGGF